MQAGTHVTLPYCWDMRSAGTYNTHHFSFHLHGWHTHPRTTPLNIHTSHVTTIHTLSTIRHYSFPLAVNPVNCYVVCYIDSLIHVCFVDLNFFFGLQCFHWDCVLYVLDWCQWGRKYGGRGGKCHNMFVRGPREAPLYMSHIPFTVLKLGGF